MNPHNILRQRICAVRLTHIIKSFHSSETALLLRNSHTHTLSRMTEGFTSKYPRKSCVVNSGHPTKIYLNPDLSSPLCGEPFVRRDGVSVKY